jgi:hypothetical protein
MMKKLLCLLLATFALSLVVPSAEAAIKNKPALVKAGKKSKSAKHKKHRKHGKRHHKAAKSKA